MVRLNLCGCVLSWGFKELIMHMQLKVEKLSCSDVQSDNFLQVGSLSCRYLDKIESSKDKRVEIRRKSYHG